MILAGEGKTGTESLSTALAMLGLKVAHFDSLVQCCSLKKARYNLGKVDILGDLPGFPAPLASTIKSMAPLLDAKEFPICETGPRGASRTTCENVSWAIRYKYAVRTYCITASCHAPMPPTLTPQWRVQAIHANH